MPKALERDLGLYTTTTISIGAMVGGGIFVLPGLAGDIAGPAVVAAYLLAGLVVLPAAQGSDFVIASTAAHHILYDVLFGTLPDRLVEELDCTVILVHVDEPRRHTFLRYLLQRVAF